MRMPEFRRWASGWSRQMASPISNVLLWSGCLLAALWLAAAAVTNHQVRREAERQADAISADKAAAIAQELTRGIESIDQVLRAVDDGLRDPELQRLTPSLRNAMLFSGAAMLPDLVFLDALNADGDVIASRQPAEHPSNWASRDYFTRHKSNATLGLLISRPFSTTSVNAAGVAFSRRLSRTDGSFAGVVVCGIRLSYVRTMFEGLAQGPHGAIALYHADGVMLMHLPLDTNAIGFNLDPAGPLTKAVQRGAAQVTLTDPIDHVRRQFTLRRIGSLPLVVAVGYAPEDIDARWQTQAWSFLAVGALLALLTIGLALRLRWEMRRREAAERDTSQKARFLATMSHELRAPLHGILGYAEQLRNAGDLAATQARCLNGIIHAGRLMREVVDRLLDFWRLEARGPALRMQPVDVPALLDECIAVVAPEARAKSLALTCTATSDVPRSFITDGIWLRQIVVNLMTNAVKFTHHGSVELRYGGNKDRIWIEVADTGPGIPPHQRQRLFREYERLGADDGGVEGTGLGLSIADRLTRLMGGHIGHRDNPGGGSVFWIDVPAGEAAPPSPALVVPLRAADRKLHILIVDDSATHLDVACSFLAGHDVQEAASGSEAVQLAGQNDFDVILLDMCMPVMNGLEVARRIRALPGRRGAVPIVAVTANALDEHVEQYRGAGLKDHLSKPFTERELLDKVIAAAGRNVVEPEFDAPLLNVAVLTEFEASVGEERAAQHLTTLVDSTARMMASLRDTSGTVSTRQLAECVHVIAGDAGQLGFTALSTAARRFMPMLEDECEGGAAAAATLYDVAVATQNELRQRLESHRCALAQSTNLS